jgi:hypothetical protein
MVIATHVGLKGTNSSYTSQTCLIDLKMYCLMSHTIIKSCPKLRTSLISNT